MVQVTGEFPEPGLSVGNMGLSSVAFLFGILSYGVLAAWLCEYWLCMGHSERRKGYMAYPVWVKASSTWFTGDFSPWSLPQMYQLTSHITLPWRRWQKWQLLSPIMSANMCSISKRCQYAICNVHSPFNSPTFIQDTVEIDIAALKTLSKKAQNWRCSTTIIKHMVNLKPGILRAKNYAHIM